MDFKKSEIISDFRVYSGSFAFIGSELADYTIFRLISRRFDEKWLLLFTNRVLAAIYIDIIIA